MKTIPSALSDHLAGTSTTLCRCWRVIRLDGVTLGFTEHDRDISFDATIFEARCGLSSTELDQTAAFGADTQDVQGAFSSERIEEDDLRGGRYDGATVELWLVNWSDPGQRLLERVFVFGEASMQDGAFRIELRSRSADLAQPFGRRFSRSCDADLGDTRCTVDLGSALFSAAGSVETLRGELGFVAAGLSAYQSGWFSGGRLTFDSGMNAGLSIEVADHQSTAGLVSLQMWKALPNAVAPGDAFTVRAGCDKRFATCREKFANAVNFRGFPHMPGNDFSFGYARKDAVMDGSPLSNERASRRSNNRRRGPPLAGNALPAPGKRMRHWL